MAQNVSLPVKQALGKIPLITEAPPMDMLEKVYQKSALGSIFLLFFMCGSASEILV
jgi:hypothetical protein